MSILAMYEAGQWQCPARVLTHLDDISVQLAERGLLLAQIAALAEDPLQQEHQARDWIAAQGRAIPDTVLAGERQGEPGYVEETTLVPAEAIRRSEGQWLLLGAGQARLCLTKADHALILAARRGDLLWLPAGYDWALVPAPGTRCVWLELAAQAQALNDKPVAGSKLGELQLLDI